MTAPRPSRFAPAAAAVLLAVLLGWNTVERDTTGGVDQYMDHAEEQIDAVPFRIGRFLGTEMRITQLPAIDRLLGRHHILQRRYMDPTTGDAFSLLIVHCQRADNMYGHYPPNCYPNGGWITEREPEQVVVTAGDIEIPARRYRFRHDAAIVPERTDILGFFIVPAGQSRFGGDMRLVDMSTRSPATDKLGAAQVQILTPADMPEEVRTEIWGAALEAIAPVLQTIAEGV
jgi:hypothetical protein